MGVKKLMLNNIWGGDIRITYVCTFKKIVARLRTISLPEKYYDYVRK